MNSSQSRHRLIAPVGLPRPRGFSHGVAGSGETLFIAGQIGVDSDNQLVAADVARQFDQALANVLAVVDAAGGTRTDLVQMMIYVVDLDEYRAAGVAIGQYWRRRLGTHYPAMALMKVAGLLVVGSKVELTGTALLPLSRSEAPR